MRETSDAFRAGRRRPLRRLIPHEHVHSILRRATDARASFGHCVGFGIVSGWLVLATLLATRWVDPRISMASLRANRHFLWMVPVSVVGLFTLVGLGLALLNWSRPRWIRPVAARGLCALTCVSCLLEIEGLHIIAALVLGVGLGVRLGPPLERMVERWRGRVRGAVAALAAVLVGLVGAETWRVSTSEARALSALPSAKEGATNVLLVVLDNVRAASLSLHGRERPTSPQLERIAREGVTFLEARSTSSWTLASHASMMTGRWCHELDFDFDRALGTEEPTLAEVLSRRGYATAGFVGNTYYANARYGLARGFARYEDHYENLEVSLFEIARSTELGRRVLRALGYPIRVEEAASIRKTAEMINRDVLAWLDGPARGRPFLAFLNYFDAHAPFIPPHGATIRFGAAALPEEERAARVQRLLRLQSRKPPPSPEEAECIQREAAETRLDSYESCIAYLDAQIGKLLDELERRGLTENTLVIITSDHGEHIAEHGLEGHGNSLYRREVHVPLIARLPGGARAGRRVTAPVSNRDVAATILDVLGIDREALPGVSLARHWNGEPECAPEVVLSELGRRKGLTPTPAIPTSVGPLEARLLGSNVYIHNGDGREELYDLGVDPYEMNDLAHDPRFRAVLDSFRAGRDAGASSATNPRNSQAPAR